MEIATELLEMTGAAVDCVADGQKAVEKFEASSAGCYDMIFLDVQMPVMNGYTAARKIRASYPYHDIAAQPWKYLLSAGRQFSSGYAGGNCRIAMAI